MSPVVEPTTQLLQYKVWVEFEKWLRLQISLESFDQVFLCLPVLVLLLRSYGFFLYGAGHAMYEYRHLLVVAQQRFSGLRQYMQPAWQLITKREIFQPVQHRRPLHFVLYRAGLRGLEGYACRPHFAL